MDKKNKSDESEAIFKLKLDSIKKLITSAEENLNSAKALFNQILDKSSVNYDKEAEQAQIKPKGNEVFGIFNGENMIGDNGKKFSIPANYASKSKLVPGDRLKLIILEDGTFIYKQISPIERRKLTGILKTKNNKYIAHADGESYQILSASVSFFKVKEGDKLTIIIPKDKASKWAAVENILPK